MDKWECPCGYIYDPDDNALMFFQMLEGND